ncbi:Hachiman antiphage defense system protein HamA [Pseudomonas aeruginosa]|uniref:Hachiman antiphage defense system protein HamA n=1 Tax=Pseudomonas aeruginosa TaxID=287 RepID=UPI003D32FAE2
MQNCLALADHLSSSIKSYIFDQQQLAALKEEDTSAYKRTSSFFGNTKPVVDGKYGELMLYMLFEAVLKTPMAPHKLQLMTNINNQVKGGDGIFSGKYANHKPDRRAMTLLTPTPSRSPPSNSRPSRYTHHEFRFRTPLA